jgi:hypothetical protein
VAAELANTMRDTVGNIPRKSSVATAANAKRRAEVCLLAMEETVNTRKDSSSASFAGEA